MDNKTTYNISSPYRPTYIRAERSAEARELRRLKERDLADSLWQQWKLDNGKGLYERDYGIDNSGNNTIGNGVFTEKEMGDNNCCCNVM
jgi:hypothetical protein